MLTCRKLDKFLRKITKIRKFSNWNDKNLIFETSLQLYIPDDIGKDQLSLTSQKSVITATATATTTYDKNDFHVSSTISPEVIYSMIKAGFDKGDYETVQLVINEAKLLGKLSGEILEKSIVDFIHCKDYKHTMILFVICIDNNYVLSNVICKAFHAQLVTNCYWYDATIVAEYMIKSNYRFRSLDIYFLVSGLMKDSEKGLSKALRLIQLISEYRRDDLSTNFDHSKVS
jgi:hypothetical protein